jgi:hypothetical protein
MDDVKIRHRCSQSQIEEDMEGEQGVGAEVLVAERLEDEKQVRYSAGAMIEHLEASLVWSHMKKCVMCVFPLSESSGKPIGDFDRETSRAQRWST